MLASSESHIRSQIQAALKHFKEVHEPLPGTAQSSEQLLRSREKELLSNDLTSNVPSVMITFKTSHADDVLAVKKLLRAGMNIARINCAHDEEKVWLQMVQNLRKGSGITGLPCKIYMDLAGS